MQPVQSQPVTVRVERTKVIGISHFQTGVTHTQYSLDPWGDVASVARGRKLLSAVCTFQNQHIMGWGADNPNPSPGVYNWESLDRRMAAMRAMGATPVITLCGAPDWMKGGQAGQTDWSRLEAAPTPEHYADFASLCAVVARRYPDVSYFQVWNEMKGLWDAPANNWNYAAYTRLYNMVYDALKAVRPGIKVGGPYLVIEGTGSNRGGWATEKPIRQRQWQVLDYWLKHKRGADFICLDKSLRDFHDANSYTEADALALTHWFGDVARQGRTRTKLPRGWAEYYGASSRDRDFIAAHYASIMGHMVKSGAAVALLWQPQDDGGDLSLSLFSDTRRTGGGQALSFYFAFKAFHDAFKPGAKLVQATSSSPNVEVLASPRHTLLINKRAAPVQIL